MAKTKKMYSVKKSDGKLEIRLEANQTTDGKVHTSSCDYPFYQPDGAGHMKRLSQAQTEKLLWESLQSCVKVS